MFPVAALLLSNVKRRRVPEGLRNVFVEHALVLEGILVGFVVSSTFGSHFKIDFMWWYFGLIAALALIGRNAERAYAAQALSTPRPGTRRLRPVAAST
jgi:hypothetical protein